jgi:catechol 2,3-dioxygenase-like lactoylglutathione lyase family enzyme
MNDTPDVRLLMRIWEARVAGDLGPLRDALAPDAQWFNVSEGEWDCHDRDTILRVMQGNMDRGISGSIEDVAQFGTRIAVSFRPEGRAPSRRLDNGLIYVVVTVNDGAITELKACESRASAVEYAETGRRPGQASTPAPAVRAPDVAMQPPAQRVRNLIPFVNVADVARSIDFYRHLGFVVTSEFAPGDELIWAALESERAQLMLNHSHDPVDASVLFYLYSDDLQALREQLISAGVDAGEIVDGRPGPREEMKLLDPDGYVVMVAQIDDDSA